MNNTASRIIRSEEITIKIKRITKFLKNFNFNATN